MTTTYPYEIFGYQPNWESGITIRYSMDTVIAVSERYLEQRKPLRNTPNIGESFQLLVDYDSKHVLDYLRACLKYPMYVPIYSEPLEVTAGGSGLTFIPTSPTANLFNLLHLATYVLAIDKEGINPPALLTIDTVASQAIAVDANDFDFIAGRTILFPAFTAILDSFRKSFETPLLSGYDIDFLSYVRGDEKSLDPATDDEVFEIKPDWASAPAMDIPFGREVLQYDSGVTKYRQLTVKLPWQVSMGMTNMGKEEEYQMLLFFCNHYGMHKKFWLPIPDQYYKLLSDVSAEQASLSLDGVSFQYVYQGYERIFMLLKNGLRLGKLLSEKFDESTYGTNPAFGIDVPVTDISIFGRYLLCRFDQDELELTFDSPEISSCSIAFKEVPREYGDSPVLEAGFGWDSLNSPGTCIDSDPFPYVALPLVIIDRSSGAKTHSYVFGDNTEVEHAAEPVHSFSKTGTFNITQVIENAGETAEIKKQITIVGAPTFDFSFAQGATETIVDFDSTSEVTVEDFNWDFGDGSEHGSGQNPSHDYGVET